MIRHERKYDTDNVTGVNHSGPTANSPLQRLTATSIIGDNVMNAKGEKLGRIDNLMVNLKTGKVEYAILQAESFLGIGGKLFAIPFPEMSVDPSREIFILNRDKTHLKNLPGFDKDHWPGTNDHEYFNAVNEFWGATYQP